MVALAVRDEGEQPAVAPGVLLRVGARAVEKRHGVNQEGRVVNHRDAEKASPEETPERPAEQGTDQGRNPQASGRDSERTGITAAAQRPGSAVPVVIGKDIGTAERLAGHASEATTGCYDRRGEGAKRRAAQVDCGRALDAGAARSFGSFASGGATADSIT